MLKQIFNKIPSYVFISGAVIATAAAYVFYPSNDSNKKRKSFKQKSNPRGLLNYNNECFMNVILQSLSSSENVTNWLSKYSNLNTTGNLFSTLMDILKKINRSDDVLNEEQNDFYAAQNLRTALNTHNWHIKLEENDCHELFHLLMDCLDEEQAEQRKSFKSLNYFNYPNFTNSMHPSNPFHGYLASQLQCLNCGYKYPMRLESFYSLSLTLPQRARNDLRSQFTLDDCLKNYFRIEYISELKCEKCKNEHIGSFSKGCIKKSAIAKLPDSLCLQIQRNSWSDYSHQMIKQTDFVQYPLRINIDGHKKTTSSENSEKIFDFDNYSSFSLKQLGISGLIGGNSSPKSDQIKIDQQNQTSSDFYELKSAIVHYGSGKLIK